jgi:hypothetical protein
MIGPVGSAERKGGEHSIAFEAYGVRLAMTAPRPGILERMREFLPPGSRACPPEAVERTFGLRFEDNGGFILTRDGQDLSGTNGMDLDLALEMFDTQLRIYLGRTAPDTIFIHAGVVAHGGVAMVIPSSSFAGKTTLVTSLVRLGAVYYSDEFAVINRDGRIEPYAKPLSLRESGGWKQTDHAVETFGGKAGDEPMPLGMIVITSYRQGADWDPKRLSAGAGAMALLSHAVPAKERPDEVMQAISVAAKDAVVLEGDRGEAGEVAPLLLQELENHQAFES